jgi:hypothetical protein
MNPLIFLLYIISALIIAWFGRNYRFGFWGYFFASLFFTPMVGAIIVIASIPVSPDEQQDD